MKTFMIAAHLINYRSKADMSVNLTFCTQELTPGQMASIHYGLNKVGFLAFSPDPFTSQELEELENLKVEYDDTEKPASQRLRAVLYRLWEQKSDGYSVFADYYKATMEKLINHFKNKLI